MNYVKINRLRGSVADYTKVNGLIKVAFNHVGPSVDLTEENWNLFIEELKEAAEAFSSNDTQSGETNGSQAVIVGDTSEEIDDDF